MIDPVRLLFSTEAEKDHVPNRDLTAYAFGLGGQNMTYAFISNWLRYFCINMLHIGSVKVGTIFFISYFWDAVNDPVIGSIVDGRRSKKGEKLRQYLIKTPPLIAALSFAMFLRLDGLPENLRLAYILVVYFCWDFFYSFQDVALWGMISVCSPLSEERARAAKWAGIGAGAGSALATVFQTVRSSLLGMGMTDYGVFLLFAFVFGMMGEVLSMSAHRMKERVRSEAKKENIFKSISYLRFNRTLLLISLARMLNNVQFKVQNAYFFESSCNSIFRGVSGMDVEFWYGLITGIPSAVAVLFADRIAKKLGGMKSLLIFAQVTSIVFRLVSYFIGFKTPGRLIAVGALMAIVGIPTSIMDFAHRSLTSDSIDYVEWKTGVRAEGISFSMQNFVSKINTGVTSLVEGAILRLLDYDSKLPRSEQNPVFMKWQWPMYMLGPAIGAVLYVLAIVFVRDDREKQKQIEAELAERRAKLALINENAE